MINSLSLSMSAVSLVFLLVITSHQVVIGSHWAIQVKGGEDEARYLAQKHEFIFEGQIGELENLYHFTSGKIRSRSLASDIRSLRKEYKVSFFEKQDVRFYEKKGFQEPTDPLWARQWALHTTDTEQSHKYNLRVLPAWIQGITGKGVTVGIVDDGLQHTHPDLAGNYDDNSSYDFIDYDNDPSPHSSFLYSDNHGTECAGVVGMSKSNGVCGVGIAYNAKIAGLRLISSNPQGTTDIQEAEALNYHFNDVDIYSNSWGPIDNGFTVEGPRTLATMALENGALKGRQSKGSIYVWASGNGGSRSDSCASDGYVNSIYTIAIGSVDNEGVAAYYDEQCSAKMAVAFSFNSNPEEAHNPTTTIRSQCTESFTGTSAASPLASGIIALALQANPYLSWRDVQYLIVYTSNSNALMKSNSSALWITNGAGINVSSQYGFGVMDAEAMVTRARNWTNVPKQIEQKVIPSVKSGYASNGSVVNIHWTVTEASLNYDTIINPTDIIFLEHVVIRLSLNLTSHQSDPFDYDDYYNTFYNNHQNIDSILYHNQSRRGDIKVTLTSPRGTQSELLPYRDRDFIASTGYDEWPFMSVQFWGENPSGDWTCTVTYRGSVGNVRVSNIEVKLYGVQTIPESVKNIPKVCPTSCRNNRCSAQSQCDSCNKYRDPETLQCVPFCPNGTVEISNYCVNPDNRPPQATKTNPLPSPTSVLKMTSVSLTTSKDLSTVIRSQSSVTIVIPTPHTNIDYVLDKPKQKALSSGSTVTHSSLPILTIISLLVVLLCVFETR